MFKKFQSEIKLFLLVALVAVVLSVGGILLVRELSPTPTVQQKNNNQESATDTSGWQTYRNDEFGFEVRYPSDWAVRDREFYKPACDTSYRAGIECFVSFAVEQNPRLLSPEEWVASQRFFLLFSPRNQEVFAIDGADSVQADVTLAHTLVGTAIVLGKGEVMYEFVSGNSAVLHQILSTFRFVDM